MSKIETYKTMCSASRKLFRDNIEKVGRDFKAHHIDEKERARLLQHYKNALGTTFITYFKKLSWEDQVYFAIAAEWDFLTSMLDEEQIATMRIVA